MPTVCKYAFHPALEICQKHTYMVKIQHTESPELFNCFKTLSKLCCSHQLKPKVVGIAAMAVIMI